MAFETWLAFCAATLVIVIIPGPTVLLVSSYAMAYGRRVAVTSALGVALGDLVAITVSLSGLGVLLGSSATAFMAVKWAGAAYLVYMGWRMFQSGSGQSGTDLGAQATPRKVFWDAALVTMFNPKSIGFFIAFVPQFISPNAPMAPQFGIIIASFVLIGAGNALAYALAAGGLANRLKDSMVWLRRAGGVTLISLGIFAAFNRG